MRPLQRSFHPKVWGSRDVAPWFSAPAEPLGEVWFTGEPRLPLLPKLLFTEDKLSVQVHPNDAQSGGQGKTEMWHILRAKPGAQIALGFKEPIAPEQLLPLSRSGEIESMLRWIDVQPGESYLVPAGTIHAIGAGLALCEIQQYSEITYRLYDYGRPRELHLAEAAAVAHLTRWTAAPLSTSSRHPGARREVECDFFTVDTLTTAAPVTLTGPMIVMVLGGSGLLGDHAVCCGEGWLLNSGESAVATAGLSLLLAETR
jgi:mannose-6-phosphate isomerase